MNPVTEGSNRATLVTNSGRSVPIRPAQSPNPNAVRHPNENILNVELQAIINTMGITLPKTQKSYDSKDARIF
jgi:hypothetical protein